MDLKKPPTWDVNIFFGLMFLLSITELFFTFDSFQFLQKTHTFHSGTERARLAFLIFSAMRTIALSAVYLSFHCTRKYFHYLFHTFFLIMSTILWIISGVLIRTMWGFIICSQGLGSPKNAKITECHELKIIEIIACVIAGVSLIATVPAIMNSIKIRKRRHERKTETSA